MADGVPSSALLAGERVEAVVGDDVEAVLALHDVGSSASSIDDFGTNPKIIWHADAGGEVGVLAPCETVCMADDDPTIRAAITKLAAENERVAQDAGAAIQSLTAGEGLDTVTQERVQHFLWYRLPMKWLTDAEQHLQIALGLGRAFELLGLPRYADLCRSETTVAVLAAYALSDADGKRAFNRAELASGIRPPDLADFEWGSVMGWEESRALSATADFLELAIAAGELEPGRRGWKTRQSALTRAHLTAARIELSGRSFLDAIGAERIETWLDTRRSPARRALVEPVVEILESRLATPVSIDDPLPPLRWFLGELTEGQPLTQTGNLGRAFVQDAATRFSWWEFSTPPRSEDELDDLHQIRHLAQRLGLARRSGRKLSLTAKGKATMTDPGGLVRQVARGLLPDHEFAAALGELTLAVLVNQSTMTQEDLSTKLAEVVHEVGWRSTSTGVAPAADDIRWAWAQTTDLLNALMLLTIRGGWNDRTLGLTDSGRWVAIEALRHRAMGPRSSPWG